MFSASRDARIKDWETSGWTLKQVFREHRHSVWCLDVSPDGRFLASGSAEGELRFWDLPTGHPAGSVDNGCFAIHGLEFSPDGNLLASAAAEQTIRIWERVKCRRSPRFLTAPAGW